MLESNRRAAAPLSIALVLAAGITIGAAYTLSPTTVWFLLFLSVLCHWAQRDLGPRERLWVLGLIGVAVLARLAALCMFFLSADHFQQPFGVLLGDERFIVDQSLRMIEYANGHRLWSIDYVRRFGDYGGRQYLLALWQLWVGPAPYGAHLISVAMWLVGAIALHRTVRCAFGPLAALGGLAVLLFTPTLFVWSISALKEPLYFLLSAITIAGAITMVRGPRLAPRVWAAVMVLFAMVAISSLRSIGLTVTTGGLILAATGWLVTRRAAAAVAVVTLGLVGAVIAVRQPPVEAWLMQQFKVAAIVHIGNVNTPGYAYRLLDPYFYTRPFDNGLSYSVPADAVRFTIRAAISFFTVPLPWDIASRPGLLLLPQQIAWYILSVLAFVGAVVGLRRDALFTWVLLGNILIGAAVVALHNGNVGTLVRMRDTVAPVIVWLSALGGCAAFEWAGRRFPQKETDAAV